MEEQILNVGDTVTRMIVSVVAGAALPEVNITRHVVTRQFSANGFSIDNTYFKLYADTLGVPTRHYVHDGFGAEVFFAGVSKGGEIIMEDRLMSRVRDDVEELLQKAQQYKSQVDHTDRHYVSTVDRTPWGVDTGRNGEST